MRAVTIPIADEVFFVLKKNEASVQYDMRTLLAMQYFKDGKLGLGLAAKMAGMTKDEFTVFLGKNDIDIYQYEDDELKEEFDLVDKIVGELA
jgi:predicted HTH domain antitoxin